MWNELLDPIINHPWTALAIIGNLILIESILSVDNAAALATMVMNLGEAERRKALRYGIWGAYIFRGLAMLFASILIGLWWLKLLGGAYLIYLFIKWRRDKQAIKDEVAEEIKLKNKSNRFYELFERSIGSFWATVAAVEIMDLTFSIDNVFAAVAFSKNIILVCTGVFIGILAMRFVAQGFIHLMERFPNLEGAAYYVILFLGLKLILSCSVNVAPESSLAHIMENEWTDIASSVLTLLIFSIPIVYDRLLRKKN
jgi:YkoY family integral membrane protein